ncbi:MULTISPECIES: MFS transporter [Pseudomonas]|nr:MULTISPECIES: MFS transporter [Pseudomonas]MDH4846232.1 MFS transporter [Pseudomonas sp. BN605]MDH4858521.1 MFS transporter [Pseudomonas sp. BN505]
MNTTDPRVSVRLNKMSRFQLSLVLFCVLLAALDGFDVLVMAFVAPALAKSWQLSATALGGLFSAGLIGMACGAFFIAPLGDRFGRRPVVLGCLLLLTIAMFASAFTGSFTTMFIARLLTGIGVGAMLTTVNIVITEFSNDNRRSLCNAGMSVGVPLGATLGGLLSVALIHAYGWQAPFIFGGVLGALLLPAAWKIFPESLDFLIEKQPSAALQKLNTTLARLDVQPMAELPARSELASGSLPLVGLFSEGLRTRLLLVCALNFCILMTFYFVSSWIPKILSDAGLSISGGISGSMLLSLGGMVGCLVYGLYATKVGTHRLAALALIGLFVMMQVFSNMEYNHYLLIPVALVLGFFLYSTVTTLYVIVPLVFPPALRSTGTGLAMGVGRIGAFSGPFVAGVLIDAGWSRGEYFLLLGMPILASALMIYALYSSAQKAIKLQPLAE